MPCCLVVLLGVVFPRLVLVLLLLFTRWIGNAFHGLILPILGFIFLPYTTLWYVVVMNEFGGQWGLWQVVFLVLAVILDVGGHGGGARAYRRRRDY